MLLILTDDQGWGDLSYNKNPYLSTPSIDKLAKEGASFSNFYVRPLCAPTRASLLTGRYHLRSGAVSVSKGLAIMNENETTLAELFAANGYNTALFGKWHNGSHYPNDPNGQGFKEFLGFCRGYWSNYFNTTYQHNQEFEKDSSYITDVLTSKAIDFIIRNKQKPFLCYLAINTPHTPHQVPDKYFNKYKKKGLSDELAGIYGMCENIDDNVGQITSVLKKYKLDKNTIVIFLTDNGPNGERYNGLLRDIKGSLYEGGVKSPCFITWPGKIKKAVRINSLSQHIDLFPTLADLCNLKYNSKLPLDGKSRAGLLLGKRIREERNIYSHVSLPVLCETINPMSCSIRNNRYSLILKGRDIELFDLINDPSQKTNIAEKIPEIAQRLKEDYFNWFNDCIKDYNPRRPIPLDGQSIILPAYEASFSSGLKFKEGHEWVHDWLIDWGANKDTITWFVENKQQAIFSFFISYVSAEATDGILIKIMANKTNSVSTEINIKCDPPYIYSQDRVVRKEAYEREWCSMEAGKLSLPADSYFISVTTDKVGGSPL
ncbi:MAG: arylsulfatase [Chitinophagaceae bacterium]